MEEPGADGTMDGLQEAFSADQLHNHNDDKYPTPSFPAEEEICLDSGDETEEILAPPRQIQAEPGAQKDAWAGLPGKTALPTEHPGQLPTGDEPGGAASSGDNLRLPPFSLPVGAEEALPATRCTSGELEECSPSVVEGTTEEDELFTMEELNDRSPPPSADVSQDVAPLNPSLEGLPESSPAPADMAGETRASPTSVCRSPEPSPSANRSTQNGPSAPSSSGPSSDSCPQTKPFRPATKTPTTATARTHTLSSPYDTYCSCKLISEIQHSLSQESLLDDLESEILACRLPRRTGDGVRAGCAGGPGETANRPVNGLPNEQQAVKEECMVGFQQCVQLKYMQQEQAINRLLDENKKHQDLILGICSEKDAMRRELKKRSETDRIHLATISQLENRVDELLKELRVSRDKLVHQDQSAKASLQHAHRDAAQHLEQPSYRINAKRVRRDLVPVVFPYGFP